MLLKENNRHGEAHGNNGELVDLAHLVCSTRDLGLSQKVQKLTSSGQKWGEEAVVGWTEAPTGISQKEKRKPRIPFRED